MLSSRSMNERPPLSRRTLVLATLAGVLLLAVLAYAPGLNGDFQFDDSHTVQFNRGIRHLDHFLSGSAVLDALHGRRVLTEFTFALNYWAAGIAPFFFHVTNLAIHLATTLLVFLFTRRIFALSGATGWDFLAVAVAAVFALHPLQTQAVIYVSQRAESLASGLYIGSLLLLLRAERRSLSKAGVASYVASLVLFALGFCTKVIVATLPLAYLLIGLVPGPQQAGLLARTWKRLALAVPFFAYALSTTLSTVTDLKGVDAGFSIPLMPPFRYFFTEWHVLVTYMSLLFWPSGQNMDWDFPLAHGLGDPVVLGSGCFLVVLLAGAGIAYLRCRSRADKRGSVGRVAAFGVAWFFLLLAPTSSVVPLADVLMEHRVYLASLGVFLAAAVLVQSLAERLVRPSQPRLYTAALVCLCAGLTSATYCRVGLWRSKLALWSDCVAKSPLKARVHLGLGNALGKDGNIERAIAEFRYALDLARKDPLWLRQEIRGKLGTAFLMQGRPDDAIAYVKEGLAEQAVNANLLGLLAMVYLQQRNLSAAEAAAEDSVRASPEPSSSLQILSTVRRAKGDQEGEVAALERAVQLDPWEPQCRLLLARVYREQGRMERACELLRAPTMERVPQAIQALADCSEP